MADLINILNGDGGNFETDPFTWDIQLEIIGLYKIDRVAGFKAQGNFSMRIQNPEGAPGFFDSQIQGGQGRFAWLNRAYFNPSRNGFEITPATSGKANYVTARVGITGGNIVDPSKWRLKLVSGLETSAVQNGLIVDRDLNVGSEKVFQSPFNDSVSLQGLTPFFGNLTQPLNAYAGFGVNRLTFILYHNEPISSNSFRQQTDGLIIYIDQIRQSGSIDPITPNATLSNPDNLTGDNGSISLAVTGGPANSVYTYEWSNGATTSSISGLSEGNYTVLIRVQGTGIRHEATFRLDFTPLEDLEVSGTVSNVTVDGANDGAINLLVSGGSGDYTFGWSNSENTQNLTGLAGGNYSVNVTDNQTEQEGFAEFTVIEPGITVPELGFFEIPKIQSITFARGLGRNEIEDGNYWDLSLHGQQKDRLPTFGYGFCYFQKFRQVDRVPLQIRSEVSTINVELFDSNNEFVRSFLPQKKTEYFNQILDFSVLLQNNGGGTTRIYFQGQQTIPVELEPGESTIEITNAGAISLNGNYLVLSEDFDALQNQEYLVINHNYTESLNAYSATGLVPFSRVPFDIYESIIDFQTVNEGQYYIKAYLAGFEADSVYYSEPILIQERHDNTVKIEFTNFDNAYDIDYTTGFNSIIRPDCIMFNRVPATDNTAIRNTDNSKVILRSRPQRKFEVQFISLPPYLFEKLSLALVHDVLKIQGVEFTCEEGLAEPDYIDRFGLASAVAIVEQKDWFGTFNSDDIGGIESDQDLIIGNSGFIKR